MAAKARVRPRAGGVAFLHRVRGTLRRYEMLRPGDVLVVAASGGADSTALLHSMAALAGELDLVIHVAHLNHRLRPEAEADAAFVAGMSRTLGFLQHQDAADPRRLAEEEGLSIEDAGRRLRYAFLTRVAQQVGANAIATGHTLDDQAETLLIRLLRGSGLDGLGGIPPVRESDGVRIIRPLIETTRRDVEAYLREMGAAWRDDATNSDPALLRNRVRLVLLPALEGYNPDVRRTLARATDLLRDEVEALDSLAGPQIETSLSGDGGAVRLPLGTFARLPAALQRRAMREAIRRARGNLGGVQFVHIEGARRLLLDGEAGSWVPLPGGMRVTRLAEVGEVAPDPAEGGAPVYHLPVPGNVVALEFGVRVVAERVPPDEYRASGEARGQDVIFLDADRVGDELVVRGPQPGDRFAPAGMEGRTKAVGDYLRDAKVPRHRRSTVPVLTAADGTILWIVGMRAAEAARPSPTPARVVRVTAQRLKAHRVV